MKNLFKRPVALVVAGLVVAGLVVGSIAYAANRTTSTTAKAIGYNLTVPNKFQPSWPEFCRTLIPKSLPDLVKDSATNEGDQLTLGVLTVTAPTQQIRYFMVSLDREILSGHSGSTTATNDVAAVDRLDGYCRQT